MAGRPTGGIVLFDSVNPLPFMLGIEPTRGANLWSTWNAPKRLAGEYLAGARYVLVPKFSTSPQWTEDLIRLYGGYLDKRFRQSAETRSDVASRLERRSPSHHATQTPTHPRHSRTQRARPVTGGTMCSRRKCNFLCRSSPL